MKKKVVPVVASVLGASLLLTACGGNKDNASGAKANDKAPDKQQLTYHLLQKFQQWMLQKQRMGNP